MKNKCVIMCSGGPDSMALLDMLFNEKTDIIVAHVNYQKRDTAERDEKIVADYCNKRNIPFKVLYPVHDTQSNFQSWARDVRYDFAIRLAEENDCKTVMVAHQLDDVLETYLMQKKRCSTPDYYGIDAKVKIGNISIERPLLDKTKAELEKYCIQNQIPYGIDESNLSDDYTRNRIRHQEIDKMSREDKMKLLDEINEMNMYKKKLELEYQRLVDENQFCDIEVFRGIKNKEIFIRLFTDKNLSGDFINEIIRQLLESDKVEMKIKDRILVKEYGIFYMYTKEEYSYQFDQPEMIDTKYFGIKEQGNNFEGVTVREDDYPIIIRNYQAGDKIVMRYGTKKISRWFIDNKILTCYRNLWPVVCNSKNEVILVPGIGCNSTHFSNNPTFFVLQYLIN